MGVAALPDNRPVLVSTNASVHTDIVTSVVSMEFHSQAMRASLSLCAGITIILGGVLNSSIRLRLSRRFRKKLQDCLGWRARGGSMAARKSRTIALTFAPKSGSGLRYSQSGPV
jgi:hypothetical protein